MAVMFATDYHNYRSVTMTSIGQITPTVQHGERSPGRMHAEVFYPLPIPCLSYKNTTSGETVDPLGLWSA